MQQRLTVPASEFARHFAKYQDVAISTGIVYVTSYSRTVGAYLSAAELERYELLQRRNSEELTAERESQRDASVESQTLSADTKEKGEL